MTTPREDPLRGLFDRYAERTVEESRPPAPGRLRGRLRRRRGARAAMAGVAAAVLAVPAGWALQHAGAADDPVVQGAADGGTECAETSPGEEPTDEQPTDDQPTDGPTRTEEEPTPGGFESPTGEQPTDDWPSTGEESSPGGDGEEPTPGGGEEPTPGGGEEPTSGKGQLPASHESYDPELDDGPVDELGILPAEEPEAPCGEATPGEDTAGEPLMYIDGTHEDRRVFYSEEHPGYFDVTVKITNAADTPTEPFAVVGCVEANLRDFGDGEECVTIYQSAPDGVVLAPGESWTFHYIEEIGPEYDDGDRTETPTG